VIAEALTLMTDQNLSSSMSTMRLLPEKADREIEYEDALSQGDQSFAANAAAGRVGRHRAELYLWHHG